MSHDDHPEAPLQGRHGLYDLRRLQVSQHALERFRERVESDSHTDESFSNMLRQCRKLGTNPDKAAAYMAISKDRPFVLIVKETNVVTCMTLDQFETVMADFGRHRWPRRFGRWLRKSTPGRTGTQPEKSPEPE